MHARLPEPNLGTLKGESWARGQLYYLGSIAAGLAVWPLAGGAMAVAVGLTLFSGLLLAQTAFSYGHQRAWTRIVAELVTPAILWLMFGVGGVAALLGVEGVRYYGPFERMTVALMTGCAILGILAYLIGFRVANRSDPEPFSEADHRVPTQRVLLLLTLLLALDWYIRVKQFRAGIYFTWIAKIYSDQPIRGGGLLGHMQDDLNGIVLSLLLYVAFLSRLRWKKWICWGIVLFQIGIISLTGSRSDILFALLICGLTLACLHRSRMGLKQVVVWSIAGLLFFGIFSPIIQEARILMRRDAASMLSDPASVPLRFADTYLPVAMEAGKVLGDESTSLRKGGMVARMGSYMSYAASMYQSVLNGTPRRPGSEFLQGAMVLVPRIIYPSKPRIDADAAYLEYFGIGVVGVDSNGSPLADVFSYFGLFGVVGLFLVGGLGFGFLYRHLVRSYGTVGHLLLIGMLAAFQPTGDAFYQYLAVLRNMALFVVPLAFLFRFRIRPTARTFGVGVSPGHEAHLPQR